MREREIGIFHMHQEIAPEAIKAQRMAELRDIAEYRARHLKAITDWSDPVKRAAIIERNEREIRHAQHLAQLDPSVLDANRSAASYRNISLMTSVPVFRPLGERIAITPIVKPAPPRRSWLARLRAWMS